MPKQTFFNLPDAKRTALIEAATEEFANNDYENASVSRVVATLGIAKGSLYQYFEDKRDLYLYLIEMAFQERIAFAQSTQPYDPSVPFKTYVRAVLETAVSFGLAHPQLNQLIYRAMFGDVPFRDETLQRMRDSSLALIRQMLQQGIAAGEINPAIDVEMIAYILNLIASDFSSYVVAKFGIDTQQLMTGAQLDSALLDDIFTKAIDFLQFGLSAKPRSET